MGWSKFDESYMFNDKCMFVDREEIIKIFDNEYKDFISQKNYFKVINIYGIGGIGKSSLMSHLINKITPQNFEYHIIKINMDIMHSAETFENLIKVRKQINYSCVYFDYALLLLWDLYKTEKIDDEFIYKIKGNFLDILNSIESLASYWVPTPGFSNILSLVRRNVSKISNKYFYDKEIFEKIDTLLIKNTELLYEYMPHLLGLDLSRLAKDKKLIAFFDSYEKHLVDHDDWLKELIGSVHQGLFVIASRENVRWDEVSSDILEYYLKELPERQAELVLKASLRPEHYEIINRILQNTKCVPIYIEIAINLYRNILKSNPESVSEEFWMIENKADFIRRFLHHLPKADQEIVLLLSVVRIFNARVFEWIVHDLNLQCTVLKFYDLCKLCLINLLQEDENFLKLHDVFSNNAIKFIGSNEKHRILSSYIKYIATRGLIELTLKELSILFHNLLQIAETIKFDVTDIEYLCDIFFVLYESKSVPELNKWVAKVNAPWLSDFKSLVSLVFLEIKDAYKSYNLSLKCDNKVELGRHLQSFKLIQNYARAVAGKYEESIEIDEILFKQIQNKDIPYWYYGKTLIYHGDHLMLQGDFRKAIDVFNSCKVNIENYSYKVGDLFEAEKQIGHCKRFNMMLEDADKTYQSLYTQYSHCSGLSVLVLTNRCETNCYFNPDVTIELSRTAIDLCIQTNRLKDLAKVYYSLGIAYTVKKQYELAKACILKSIDTNKSVHYPAGELFAFIAEAYLEYSENRILSCKTYTKIVDLIDSLQVYQFLKLPISVLYNKQFNVSILSKQFNWLDFDYTISQYKRFFYML